MRHSAVFQLLGPTRGPAVYCVSVTWKHGEMDDEEQVRDYDVVVIGAGPAGENAAQYATQHSGLSAVLVEQELVGGECSYYACMPSKALLVPLDVASQARHLEGLTVAAVDRRELLARRDSWVSHYQDAGQVTWAKSAGIDVVRGTGRLIGEKQVRVEGPRPMILHARHAVVVATGSLPVVPALYRNIGAWGSRDATAVVEVPERLVIIGGGVVACEVATWMHALGARVTMLVRGARVLDNQEPFASELVAAGLRSMGVDIRTGAQVESCERPEVCVSGLGHIHGGEVRMRLAGEDEPLVADEILVSTGRKPSLEGLGLETISLEPDDVLGGSVPEWLHVIGDASGGPKLTHMGKYQARIVGEQIAAAASGAEPDAVPEEVPVPQVVFTEPQLAHTGFTEDQARAQGMDVVITEVDYSSVAGASLLRNDLVGHAMLVVKRPEKVVVGATFVGPGAGELIHAATIAVLAGVPIPLLRHAVPSYPTTSELWLRLIESLPEELLH